MPSGGFIYMDGRQLVRDLQGGLLKLTWNQLMSIRNWTKEAASGEKNTLHTTHYTLLTPAAVLAVGDIVPFIICLVKRC